MKHRRHRRRSSRVVVVVGGGVGGGGVGVGVVAREHFVLPCHLYHRVPAVLLVDVSL